MKKNCKSFTLTEILVAVIVVGVLSSLALGNYEKISERLRAEEGKTILQAAVAEIRRLQVENAGVITDAMVAQVTQNVVEATSRSQYFKEVESCSRYLTNDFTCKIKRTGLSDSYFLVVYVYQSPTSAPDYQCAARSSICSNLGF